MSGWQRVSFSADCIDDACSLCGLDYADECRCPGPTQDGYEYRVRDGVLEARLTDGDPDGAAAAPVLGLGDSEGLGRGGPAPE
jgi:hypothetical protein